MKLLILGAYGMLGHRLFLELGRRCAVVGTCRQLRPELVDDYAGSALTKEYNSGDTLMTRAEIAVLLERHDLLVDGEVVEDGEMLR